MIPSTDDIFTITQNVLHTMVNMDASLGQAAEPTAAPPLTGCVQISGQWQGAVVVRASENFVRSAAQEMLQVSAEEVLESDLQDVLAELTNMIGGNIKSQVPGPSFLSIPSVTTGQDFRFHLKGAAVVSDTAMTSHDEPLNVLICESQPNV